MLRRNFFLGFLGISAPLFCAQRKGTKKKPKAAPEKPAPAPVAQIFSDEDRRVILDFVRQTPEANMPPGLAKKDKLPMGIEQQLRRKAQLPSSLSKQLYPVPAGLQKKLKPLPPELEHKFISGYAIIYSPRDAVIVDMMLAAS
jgi:hypothetical protein